MPTPVIMPKFEMTQEQATVIQWLRQEGETVEKGEPLLEVETDKVTMEVEAPATGILAGIVTEAGATVPVTEVIAFILQPGEALPSTADRQRPVAPKTNDHQAAPSVKATPVALRRASEAGVDIDQVAPAHPTRRVTRQDVESHLAQASPSSAALIDAKPRATPAARRLARQRDLNLAEVAGSGPKGRIQATDILAYAETGPVSETTGAEDLERIPLQGLRRSIATRLQQSYQTAPHIMLTRQVDMSAALALKQTLDAEAAAESISLSVTALLVKICAWALPRHRHVNATFEEETIYLHPSANIGVAVAVPDNGGLVVPVIKQAERLGLAQIARRLADLSTRGQQGDLALDEVKGGSFTISNLGMYGVDHFTAIINPPQVALLAVGRIAKQPVVVEGEAGDELVIKPMMTLTLAADHRVLDGAVAAHFLADVARGLEQPNLLLW